METRKMFSDILLIISKQKVLKDNNYNITTNKQIPSIKNVSKVFLSKKKSTHILGAQ